MYTVIFGSWTNYLWTMILMHIGWMNYCTLFGYNQGIEGKGRDITFRFALANGDVGFPIIKINVPFWRYFALWFQDDCVGGVVRHGS